MLSPGLPSGSVIALALAVLLAGCRQTPRLPDLGGLYDDAAQHHGPHRNPVLVLPGMLGSRLVDADSGRIVWGAFDAEAADPRRVEDARLIALPMRAGEPLVALTDAVHSDGVLDRVQVSVLGLPVDLAAYAHILASLGVGGYRDESLGLAGVVDYGDEHFTCFQLDYDWRRDIVESARRLDAFLREKASYIRAENARRFGSDPDQPVRFDVVAHSMGGLVLRWYLRYGTVEPGPQGEPPELTWAGAKHIERAILIGTPNLGSVQALRRQVEGYDPGFLASAYGPALLGTFPSVYQLLPCGRHGVLLDEQGTAVPDLFDPSLWERSGWGLADPRRDQVLHDLLPTEVEASARRQIALEHQRKCLDRARAVTAALDLPATPPAGTELFLVLGDSTPTPSVLRALPLGELVVEQQAPGDGTVLRASALADERQGLEPGAPAWSPHLRSPITWRQVLLLFSDHLGLTRDPVFTDNVLYLLLEDPRGT